MENYSFKLINIQKKLFIFLIVILVVFTYRNIHRLNKEFRIYSYNPFIESNYPIDNSGFRISERFLKMIENTNYCINKSDACNQEEFLLNKIYKNRFIILKK